MPDTDLSKLTDEQLQVYKELLSKKQGTAAPSPVTPPKVQPPPSMMDRGRSLLLEGNLSGKYTPLEEREKKTFEFPPWLNKAATIGGLAEGGASILENPQPLMNLGRAAYQGMKSALPDLLQGGAKAGVGMGTVGAARNVAPELSHLPVWLGIYPGLKQLGSGIAKGAREFGSQFNPQNLMNLIKGESTIPIPFTPKAPIVPPGEAPPPPKGPSLGMLRSAVKSGSMPMDQFEAHLSKLGFDEETKAIIRNNLQTEVAPKAGVTLGETPKTMSLGHLKEATKEGLITLEDFSSRLEKLGYDKESRDTLTELLRKNIEKEAAAKEAAKEGSSGVVNKPFSTPIKENLKVNPPKSASIEKAPTEETNPFLEEGPPYKPPITKEGIEAAQSTARAAKETKLARYLHENFEDLSKIPKTSEFLKSVGKEAGLKWEPSLRTLEGAIKRAQELRIKPIE